MQAEVERLLTGSENYPERLDLLLGTLTDFCCSANLSQVAEARLINALHRNSSLRTIDLHGMNSTSSRQPQGAVAAVGRSAALGLATVLECNTTMKVLYLGGTRIHSYTVALSHTTQTMISSTKE